MEEPFTGGELYSQHFVSRDYMETYYKVDFSDDGVDKLLTFFLKGAHRAFIVDGNKGDTLIDIGTGPTIHQFLSACEFFQEIIASDYTDQNREEVQRWLKKEPDWTPIVKYVYGIKGDTLIDIGTGPTIHQVLSACESFQEITASDYIDQTREEVQRWLKKEPDWSPIVKYVCDLEGDREKWPEKEEKVQRAIKQYLKCEVTQPNPLVPLVLPPTDCLLSSLCLDAACKDIPTYQSAFRNISSLLKPGGHLLFHSTLEGDYYMVGQRKFSALYLEKEMVEEAVRQAGFVIKWIEETRINLPPSVADGKKLCILLAQKRNP